MKSERTTIYGRYRKAAGMTQEHAEDQLLAIAADGRVDELEQEQFVALADDLDDVIAAALALRYAEGGVRAWN